MAVLGRVAAQGSIIPGEAAAQLCGTHDLLLDLDGRYARLAGVLLR